MKTWNQNWIDSVIYPSVTSQFSRSSRFDYECVLVFGINKAFYVYASIGSSVAILGFIVIRIVLQKMC